MDKKLAHEWKLTIDDEFSSVHRPLTPEERSFLEADIDLHGCRDSVVVWPCGKKKIVIDGHHRVQICTSLAIQFSVELMEFPSREAVLKWARNHQRGRRNLTDAEVKFLRGQTYEAEKKDRGGDGSNQHSAKQKAHDAPLANTAEKVAAQFDVDPATIKRDAEFARAVNSIAENVGTEARDAILTGTLDVSAKDVVKLANLPKSEQKKAVAGGKAAVKEATRDAPPQKPISDVFFDALKGLAIRIDGIREQYGTVEKMFKSKLWQDCDTYLVMEMVHELHISFKDLDKEMQEYAKRNRKA